MRWTLLTDGVLLALLLSTVAVLDLWNGNGRNGVKRHMVLHIMR
jgi:hypothetical protein